MSGIEKRTGQPSEPVEVTTQFIVNSIATNSILPRRSIVKGLIDLGAASLGVTLFVSDSALIIRQRTPNVLTPPNPILPDLSELSTEELTTRITSFEAEKGYQRLTFEEAREMVPVIVAAYAKAPPEARSSAEFLTERTFIVRGYANNAQKLTDEKNDESTNLAVRQFIHDYPNAQLTEDDKRRIGQYALGGNVAGWVGDKGLFILLTNINDVTNKNAFAEGTGRLRNTEWEEVPLGNDRLACDPSHPAVFLRTVMFHEMTHLDSRERGHTQPLSDSMIQAYNYLWRESNSGDSFSAFPDGYSWQFGVALDEQHGSRKIGLGVNNTGLLEFSTDMIAAMKTFALGLRYVMPAYDMKQDYGNLMKVFDQAEINKIEFARLYYDSELEKFYRRIAGGAKNIQFPTDLDKLVFSIERLTLENKPILALLHFPWGSAYGPDWSKFKPYYPEVDATQYQYNDRFNAQPTKDNQWVCLAPISKK